MEKLNKQNWAIKFRDWLLKRGSFPDDGGGGGSYGTLFDPNGNFLDKIREAIDDPTYNFTPGEIITLTKFAPSGGGFNIMYNATDVFADNGQIYILGNAGLSALEDVLCIVVSWGPSGTEKFRISSIIPPNKLTISGGGGHPYGAKVWINR